MKLNIAVIGLGHGLSHVQTIAENPGANLAGVVDLNAERLEKTARQYGVPGFTTLAELLSAGIAEAVVVAIPAHAHAAAGIACLEKGLHVLQEKPLCCTDEDAQAIGEAVRKSDRIFQVGYEVRSSPLHRAIMRHIANGDLGVVTNIWYNQHTLAKSAPGTWFESRADMGGTFFDCAVHYFDLMQQWAGTPVRRVAVLGNVLGKTGNCPDSVPDSVAVALEYDNGVRGTYNLCARSSFGDDAGFGIVGTTGRIMGNPWYPEQAGSYELRTEGGLFKGRVIIDGKLTSQGHLGFKEQLDNFIATVTAGTPNICPYEDALRIHRMMMALDRSLTEGTVVTLQP